MAPEIWGRKPRSSATTRCCPNGELALRSVQEEVKRLREAPTVLKKSGVGDSQTNGAAEKAAQALGEQVRMMKLGLETRLGIRVQGSHPVTAWMIEHSADLFSKYSAVADGRAGPAREVEAKSSRTRPPSSARRCTTR